MFVRICFVLGAILALIWALLIPKLLFYTPLIFLAASLLLLLAGILFLFLCSLFCYGKKPVEKDHSFCRFLAYVTMDSILTVFRFRLQGEGLEQIPAEPCILVCNHLSRFDPMVTFVLMKGRLLGFISKKENLRIPIAGPIISKIGFLPLDRENPLRAMRTLHQGAKLVREKGYTMGIYPEGTRNRGTELMEFKTGAFVMATKAKAPVVICSITGTNEYRHNLPFHKTNAVFRVLEVLPAEEVSSRKAEELADYCRSRISEDWKPRSLQ